MIVNSDVDACSGDRDCEYRIIERYSRILRNSFERQEWLFCDKLRNCKSGSNLIVQVRGKWSNPVESIVINVPLNEPMDQWGQVQPQNKGVGVAIALTEMIKTQPHWAKEFIFVFSSDARVGIDCWLASNFDNRKSRCMYSSLPSIIAHSPQTGLVLDINSLIAHSIDIKMEGDLSQMTNQDLVNVAVRVANRMGITVTFHGMTGPSKSEEISPLFFRQLLQIGTGEGTGNHASLIKHGIHALTLRSGGKKGIFNVMRVAEGLLRSENNLLERVHASIWFYIFSTISNYSSISLYMPIIGLLLLLPLGLALKEWVTVEEISLDVLIKDLQPIISGKYMK